MIKRVRFGLVAALGLLVLAACGTPTPPSTTRTLTVNVSGNGSVTSEPLGIDTADGQVTASFDTGTEVTLTAVADAGWQFDGWSGDCSGAGTCELTLDANASVTATFVEVEEPVTLTVTVAGNGSVTSVPAGIDTGGGQTEATFGAGTVVTLTAVADAGWAFAGWDVASCGFASECEVTLDENTEVTATFAEPTSVSGNATDLVEEFIRASQSQADFCAPGPRFPAGFNRSINDGSSDLDFGYDADGVSAGHRTPVLAGLRFSLAGLPQGARIDSASVSFVALAATAAPEGASVSLEVYADKNSASVPFVTRDTDCNASNNLSGRTATDASVTWVIDQALGAGDDFSTADLAAVIQELVDDAGFDGTIVILIRPTDEDSLSYRRAEMVLASTELTVSYVELP